MHDAAIGGAGFLLAVLWFDLMFDVQVRGHGSDPLPEPVLRSIAAYYRRVTTEAQPMNRLVGAAMLLTFSATVAELLRSRDNPAFALLSLACVAAAVGLALTKTVRNAVALGREAGEAGARSKLARSIYRDHKICFAFMCAFCVLQAADRLLAHH